MIYFGYYGKKEKIYTQSFILKILLTHLCENSQNFMQKSFNWFQSYLGKTTGVG